MVQSLFDRRLLTLRRKRSLTYDADARAFLHTVAADDLSERLAAVSRRFPNALALGGFAGLNAAMLERSGIADRVVRADVLVGEPGLALGDTVVDDASPPFADHSFDLVTSLLSLQDVNDLPGTLAQISRMLRPDGLLLAAMFGGETLTELRRVLAVAEEELSGGASPRVAPFVDIREAGALMQRAGFALPVVDTDKLTVRYDTLFDLVGDLRAMGATNVLAQRSRVPPPRALFFRAAEIYAEKFADADGRIRATFEIVSLSGWAPHVSQPRALKPGSARHSLADALRNDLKD